MRSRAPNASSFSRASNGCWKSRGWCRPRWCATWRVHAPPKLSALREPDVGLCQPLGEHRVELALAPDHHPMSGGESQHSALRPCSELLRPGPRMEHERLAFSIEEKHRHLRLEHAHALQAARGAEPSHGIGIAHSR